MEYLYIGIIVILVLVLGLIITKYSALKRDFIDLETLVEAADEVQSDFLKVEQDVNKALKEELRKANTRISELALLSDEEAEKYRRLEKRLFTKNDALEAANKAKTDIQIELNNLINTVNSQPSEDAAFALQLMDIVLFTKKHVKFQNSVNATYIIFMNIIFNFSGQDYVFVLTSNKTIILYSILNKTIDKLVYEFVLRSNGAGKTPQLILKQKADGVNFDTKAEEISHLLDANYTRAANAIIPTQSLIGC